MPYNPNKPADGTTATAAEMRSQLQALHADIQIRLTQSSLDTAVAGTALNIPQVMPLGTTFPDGNLQMIADKLDELINALKRV